MNWTQGGWGGLKLWFQQSEAPQPLGQTGHSGHWPVPVWWPPGSAPDPPPPLSTCSRSALLPLGDLAHLLVWLPGQPSFLKFFWDLRHAPAPCTPVMPPQQQRVLGRGCEMGQRDSSGAVVKTLKKRQCGPPPLPSRCRVCGVCAMCAVCVPCVLCVWCACPVCAVCVPRVWRVCCVCGVCAMCVPQNEAHPTASAAVSGDT